MTEDAECLSSPFYPLESPGGLLVEFLLLVYLFYAMMVLTDEFLMEYIDLSIRKFSLTVEAGACLIAFGSIVPEFTINTIASLVVTTEHNVLGLSTIVGSGCFDFTLCLAVAAFVGMSYHGQLPFPLLSIVKDYLTYVACLLLVIAIAADYRVTVGEAALLLAVTPFYVAFRFKTQESEQMEQNNTEETEKRVPTNWGRVARAPVQFLCRACIPTYTGRFWQIAVAFLYIVSLGFSITRATVFVLERLMCHASIPESLVGLTVISWGNNIGDLMNSAVAAKRGNALLSINAVLSTQILNLIFSLGFPWTLSTVFFGQMSIRDATTHYSLFVAAGVAVLSFIAIAATGQTMGGKLSLVLFALYVAYIVTEWTWVGRNAGDNSQFLSLAF